MLPFVTALVEFFTKIACDPLPTGQLAFNVQVASSAFMQYGGINMNSETQQRTPFLQGLRGEPQEALDLTSRRRQRRALLAGPR